MFDVVLVEPISSRFTKSRTDSSAVCSRGGCGLNDSFNFASLGDVPVSSNLLEQLLDFTSLNLTPKEN